MVSGRYIYSLDSRQAKRRGGYRAEQLRFLADQHLRVPKTLVCVWDAYERYLEDDSQLMPLLQEELREALHPHAVYDARPSVNVEDTSKYSFVGLFGRVLGMVDVEEIPQAMRAIWDSARAREVEEYVRSHGGDPADLEMAILIQEMPRRLVSGFALSRNPVTGARETILETVRGKAGDPTAEGARPQRWTRRGDRWQVEPEDGDAPQSVLLEVVKETQRIAEAYGRPIEVDWVYDGKEVTYVQLREITGLHTLEVYSNRISREVFPGMIKPLVWSVNVPLVNGAWLRLLTELAGPNDIDPHDLARAFFYRAYFSMGTIGEIFALLGFPRDSVELLLGVGGNGPQRPRVRLTAKTVALLPRLVRFFWDKLRFGSKIRSFLPSANERYDTFDQRDLADRTEAELLAEIDRLFEVTQHSAYYNIVAQLEAGLYTQLLRRALSRSGIELETLQLGGDDAIRGGLDPAVHVRHLSRLFQRLPPEARESIITGGYEGMAQIREAEELASSMDEFLRLFGHLSDSGTDFSSRTWRETPQMVLQMVAEYPVADEKERRQVSPSELTIPLPRRWLVRPIFRRAQEYSHHREAASAVYTRGTGLFRVYFLALGERFVRRGVLRSPEDIFYLHVGEVREIVAASGDGESYVALVNQRKREMEEYEDMDLPPIIYGDHAPPVRAELGKALTGTGTSVGEYTGPVRIVRGLEDFHKVQEGDVLAIPYSDVSWTPLFARAGAVIAESGGILSHSSIVAREYGIPAVVSVDGATQLPEGTMVTVDGYNGVVHLNIEQRE